MDSCLHAFMQTTKHMILEVLQAFDDPVIPKVMSRIDENGKMKTPALHDMYPFLEEDEIKKLMLP